MTIAERSVLGETITRTLQACSSGDPNGAAGIDQMTPLLELWAEQDGLHVSVPKLFLTFVSVLTNGVEWGTTK